MFFWQLEELYVEILYCILHMIGCDAERGGQAGMIEHLKEAFHMKEEKHKQLLDIATMREVTERKVVGKSLALFLEPGIIALTYYRYALLGVLVHEVPIWSQPCDMLSMCKTLTQGPC